MFVLQYSGSDVSEQVEVVSPKANLGTEFSVVERMLKVATRPFFHLRPFSLAKYQHRRYAT